MKVGIKAHHQKGINRLVKEYENDGRFLALIIGGSLAKGCARDDSDIDFMMVATDEEYAKRILQKDVFINRKDLTDYPNGFVDGKIINQEYLYKVRDSGNEPTRAAFDGAMIGFSKIADLDQMIHKITEYPEEERSKKKKSNLSIQWLLFKIG